MRTATLVIALWLSATSLASAQEDPQQAAPPVVEPIVVPVVEAEPVPQPPAAQPVPQPYAAPQPYGAAQGPAPYPAYGAQQQPLQLAYNGGPVPEGYHLERRPRLGMIISGAAIFGAVWLFTSLVALPVGSARDNPDALRVAIPLAGPFIGINEFGRTEAGENAIDGMLTFTGILQVVGAAVLTIGIATPKKRLVPNYSAGPTVTPILGLGNAGLRVDF